jgi:hypothetical protein
MYPAATCALLLEGAPERPHRRARESEIEYSESLFNGAGFSLRILPIGI